MVDLIDTNGVKPTLKKGVLGYDDYSVGGDAGRLYVGTGTASIAQAKKSEVDSHTSNVSNPHSVTKTQVGLGNVDNTSDVNKPVSTATQTALNTKVDKVTSTDNAIVRFDGTTGKVQNSGVIIDDNNNVGIGTSSPTSPLTVKTTSSYLTQDYLGDSTNGYVGIRFRNSGNTATTCFQNYDNGSYKIGTVGTDSVQLWTNNTERMRIDSAGNVGIGVSDPDRKLEVYSSVPSIKISDSNAKSGVPGSIAKLEFAQHYGTITSSSIEGYQDGTATDYQKGGLKFLTNNGTTLNEAMRIDTVGNVGIGVTPSAWSSGIKGLEIGSYAAIAGTNAGVQMYSNAYRGAGNYVYKNGTNATLYEQYTGVHAWYTAPSGTAGNTITWTNAMTLDASGNLLVGVTSDTLTPNNGVSIRNTNGTVGNIGIGHASGTVSGNPYQIFAYAGTQIGSIYQAGTTAVVFSTTSDYRLKENIRPADCKRFMDIKFVDYERIDGRHECGVIAHELQEIYPDLVTGEKDATEIRKVEISPAIEEVKDEDGNIIVEAVEAVYEEQEFPVYQQVNYMGLIARIGTVVQQQAKLIDELKTRIEILESK